VCALKSHNAKFGSLEFWYASVPSAKWVEKWGFKHFDTASSVRHPEERCSRRHISAVFFSFFV